MRTKQMPLTKQDSYANAIYNSATRAQQARKGGLRKQGSYEAAVESGAKNQAAAKRTKQIMQIRKQDSYTRAIGGSFEDEHSGEDREPVLKMRKQVTIHFPNALILYRVSQQVWCLHLKVPTFLPEQNLFNEKFQVVY